MAALQLSNYVVVDNVYLPNLVPNGETSDNARREAGLLRTLELFLEQSGSFLDNTVKQSIVYVLRNQRNLYKNKKECQQLIQALNRSLIHTESRDLYYLKQNLIRLLKLHCKRSVA